MVLQVVTECVVCINACDAVTVDDHTTLPISSQEVTLQLQSTVQIHFKNMVFSSVFMEYVLCLFFFYSTRPTWSGLHLVKQGIAG